MAVAEAKKKWVWEELREVMEDFQLASRKFCQTIPQLSKGRQSLGQDVFSRREEMLIRTGDIVERWKEHFEGLLNPNNMRI